MTGLNQEYHIRKLSDAESALEPGDPIVAALIESEDGEGFDRIDFSPDAWASSERPANLFALWRTSVCEPNKDNKHRIDEQTVGDLFEQLAESSEPRQLALRLILALMMMRKRLLTYQGREQRDGADVMLLRRRGAAEGEPHVEVVDPGLSEEMLADLSEQITPLLGLDP